MYKPIVKRDEVKIFVYMNYYAKIYGFIEINICISRDLLIKKVFCFKGGNRVQIADFKISIIVPVYNVQKYLEACLESLIKQTYDNYEVILVNDGSTDQSLEICKLFENKSEKVKIINQQNSGVSCARNKGLEQATGKYVMFVDSDDWIDQEMLDQLVIQVMQTEADFVMCNLIREYSTKSEPISSGFKSLTILEHHEIEKQLILGLIEKKEGDLQHILAPFRGPVGKLYNLELIRKHQLKFDDQLIIGEDFLFNLQYLKYCKKALIIEDFYYHYRANESSITRRYKEACWPNIYKVTLQKIEEFIKENGYNEHAKQQFSQLVIKYYLICLNNELRIENPHVLRQQIQHIKEMCHSDYVIESLRMINKLNRAQFDIKLMVLILTRYKMSVVLYYYLYIKREVIRIFKKIVQ